MAFEYMLPADNYYLDLDENHRLPFLPTSASLCEQAHSWWFVGYDLVLVRISAQYGFCALWDASVLDVFDFEGGD